MRVIAFKKLRGFFLKHPQAEIPLRAWYKDMQKNAYPDLNALKQTYPSADLVRPYVIFNIGGNDYRLVVAVHFDKGRVYIREVFTHAEYTTWSKRKRKKS